MSTPLQKTLLYKGDRAEIQKLEGLVTRVLLSSPPLQSLPTSFVLQHKGDCISESLLALLEENPSEEEEHEGRVIFGTNACVERAVQRYIYRNFVKVDLTLMHFDEGAENTAGTSSDPLQVTIAKDRLGKLYRKVEDYCNKATGKGARPEYRDLLLKAIAVEGGAAEGPSPSPSSSEYKRMMKARRNVQSFAAEILLEEGKELKRLLDRERPPFGGALYREAKTGRFANPVQVLTR